MRFATVCLLGLLAGCARADLLPQPPLTRTDDAPYRNQPPGEDPEFVERVIEPRVHYRILENGLRVVVVARPNAPLVASGFVCMNAGSAMSSGLGQLTSEMLLEGTLTDDGHVERKLSLGSSTPRAVVLPDAAVIGMSTLASRALTTIELLSRTVRRPAFDKGAFLATRLRIANAATADTGTLEHHALQTARSALYGEESALSTPQGSLIEIVYTQRASVVAFYKERYRPDQGALIVVGDVRPTEVFEEAQRWFGDWARPAGPAVVRSPMNLRARSTRQIGAFYQADELATVFLVALGPGSKHPDAPGFAGAVKALAGSFRARGNELLRFHEAKSYGVSGEVVSATDYSEMIVRFSVRNDDLSDALKGMLTELERLRREPLTDPELRSLLGGIEAEEASMLSSVSGTFALLAETFASGQEPWRLSELLSQRHKLTSEEVQRSSVNWLNPAGIQIVVSASASVAPVLKEFGQVTWYRFDREDEL